jgi:hypothetical protein
MWPTNHPQHANKSARLTADNINKSTRATADNDV